MSTHRVEVVRIDRIEKHPNADALGIVKVRGWICCVKLGQFQEGDLAAYIEPDSCVDTSRPEFSFLGEHKRIKVRKLRGVVSQGLLVPAPAGAKAGDDVMASLGVTHYEPPEPMTTGGDNETPPEGYRPSYDVESFYRYADAFVPGEEVVLTEKLHGTSARYCWHDGRLYCGSRTAWKKEDPASVWWKAAGKCPGIQAFCSAHPGMTLYGEVFGCVQDLTYGHAGGRVSFAGFDVLDGDRWLNARDAMALAQDAGIPWVPLVGIHPFDKALLAMADGPSLVEGAGHAREGVVIKPVVERTHPEIGRVILKVVSNAYLERA
jgi:RNA ligase (TIGR02306 family)